MTAEALPANFPDPAINDLLAELTDAGVTLAQLQGVTDQELDATYRLGYTAYAAGNYRGALDVFRFLCTYRHSDAKAWHGLAACQQMLKAYETAAHSYLTAALLGDDVAHELLHAADCQLAAGNREGALQLLYLLVASTAADHGDAEIRGRAETIIGLLEQGKAA